jgi:hypothetical protein
MLMDDDFWNEIYEECGRVAIEVGISPPAYTHVVHMAIMSKPVQMILLTAAMKGLTNGTMEIVLKISVRKTARQLRNSVYAKDNFERWLIKAAVIGQVQADFLKGWLPSPVVSAA